MSDMAEYYQQQREHQQKTKAVNRKTNSEIILFYAGFYQFQVIQHTESHMSIIHPAKGRMDYWPSTNKALWMNKTKPNKPFVIKDIEQFILKLFG